MYEIIVFDLDGTLLDTLGDLTAAVNVALREFHLPERTKEEVRSFVGNGVRLLMERACGQADFSQKEELVRAFSAYYETHCAERTKPYEGILDLLKVLRLQGVQTAVVSNKPHFAVEILAKEYFGDLLIAAVGENERAGVRKKPAPDALLAVLEKAGVERQKALYVGDSEVDIQTAKNAGVACISVTWGFKDKEFLLKNGAKILVDSPMEILALIKE